VLGLVVQGHSYRLISRELGLSKNTVADIVKRTRAASTASGDELRDFLHLRSRHHHMSPPIAAGCSSGKP